MRTLLLIAVLALLVPVGLAFAVGLVGVSSEHTDGKCNVTLTVNKAMIHNPFTTVSQNSSAPTAEEIIDIKGTVTAVRLEKNEFVVSENVKSWTFHLIKEGKVIINDREGKLADLKPGDDATVTFDRQGQQLLASAVRVTRK